MQLNQAEIQQLQSNQLSHMARSLYILYLQPLARKKEIIIDLAALSPILTSYSSIAPCYPDLRLIEGTLDELERHHLIARVQQGHPWQNATVYLPLFAQSLKQLPDRPFPLYLGWQPGPNFRQVALNAGLLDFNYSDNELLEFVDYWINRGEQRNQYGWERLFVRRLIRLNTAAVSSPRYNKRPRYDDLAPNSHEDGSNQDASGLTKHGHTRAKQSHMPPLSRASNHRHLANQANSWQELTLPAHLDQAQLQPAAPYLAPAQESPAAITAALPAAQPAALPTAQPAADNSATAPQTSFPFPEEIPWENDYNYAPSTDNAAPYTQQHPNMAQLPATATESYGAEVQSVYSNGGGLSVYNPENNAPIRYERAAAQPTAYRERRPTFSSIFTGKDEFEYIARGYSDPALHGAKDATIAGVLPASTALNYTDPQISRARAEESKQNAAYSGRLPQQTAPNFNASHTSPQSPRGSAHKDEHAGDRISMAFGRMPLPQWVTTTKMPSPSSTEATTDTVPSQRPPQNSAVQAQTAQSPEPAKETANDAQQQHSEQERQNNH